MDKKLEFTCLSENYGGLLCPQDLSLFYYDIGIDCETQQSFVYRWSDEVKEYLRRKNTVIQSTEEIPQAINNNEIYFGMCESDKGNMAVAFFRHLRNAFAHYTIGYDGEYFCKKDFQDKEKTKLTMIGKIHGELFRSLIKIFFLQKSEAEKDTDTIFSYPSTD